MIQLESLRSQLSAGKHRLSIGRVPELTVHFSAHPTEAARLIEFLWDLDPGVSNRAADVLERISRKPSPALVPILSRWKSPLLGLLAEASQNKLRWNLALIVPRLQLTVPECSRAAESMQAYLDDKSSIVRALAMDGLAGLTRESPSLAPMVLDTLRIFGRSGTPAMRARAKKLLRKMENPRHKTI